MSTDLIRKYQNDVTFLYFQTDGDVRAKFRQSYDIAVPSTAETLRYIKDGWLSQIDWNAFGAIANEKYKNEEGRVTQYLQYVDENGDLQDITCGHDAEYLLAGNPYTDEGKQSDDIHIEVQCDMYHITQELNQYCINNHIFPDDYIGWINERKGTCSVLDFFIPYFGQTYSFLYKGEEIENPRKAPEWTWHDILDVTGGKNHKPRFDGRDNNKLLFIDDVRTDLDISMLLDWEKNGSQGNPDINPVDDSDIKYYEDKYDEYFSPYYGTHQALLNSDSGMLCGIFADKVNSSNGMYSYNGDTMLAALGNGQSENEEYWSKKWYDHAHEFDLSDLDPKNPNYDPTNAPTHIIVPDDNIYVVDTVIVNKRSVKLDADGYANLKDSKTHNIYNFMYSTLIDHLDYSFQTHVADSDGSEDGEPHYTDDEGNKQPWYNDPNQIWWTNGTDDYFYDTMVNFDWVLYNSTWAKIDQYVWGYQYDRIQNDPNDPGSSEYGTIDCGADYFWETVEGFFSDIYPDFDHDGLEDNYCYPWVEMLLNAYHVGIGNQYDDKASRAIQCMERELPDLDKSNMHWGYVRVKDKL